MGDNISEELVKLYVDANVFRFDGEKKSSDENLPANFSLNFDKLFQD
jgi:hypothetical protein